MSSDREEPLSSLVVRITCGVNSDIKRLTLKQTVGEILSEASEIFDLTGPLKLCRFDTNTQARTRINSVALIRPDELLLVLPSDSNDDVAMPPLDLESRGNDPIIRSARSSVANSNGLALCSTSDWVELNVGGRIFATSRSTLTSVPDSMLATMFGEEAKWSSSVDRNGAYLIDRTPEYFAPILHFLRTGQVVLEKNITIEAVLEEARYFNVTPLVELIEDRIKEDNLRSQITFTRREFIQTILVSSYHDKLRCQGLNLAGVDLSRLDLRSINFAYTNFAGANLQQANCEYCCFECCNMSQANFTGSNLIGAAFSRANLESAIMRGCNFEDSRTGHGASLEGANLKSVQLEDSNLSRTNLRVSSLRSANLKNCNLRLAVLAGADLRDANLENCNMEKANLRGANLVGAIFTGATPVHMSMSIFAAGRPGSHPTEQ